MAIRHLRRHIAVYLALVGKWNAVRTLDQRRLAAKYATQFCRFLASMQLPDLDPLRANGSRIQHMYVDRRVIQDNS